MSWFFYVYVNGERLASGDCPDEESARREGAHYAMMYSSEGPVTLRIRRGRLGTAKLVPKEERDAKA